jgi:hypothetical protein
VAAFVAYLRRNHPSTDEHAGFGISMRWSNARYSADQVDFGAQSDLIGGA